MANAKICDKCGHVFKLDNDLTARRYFIRDKELKYHDEYVDLCQDCYEELVKFLNSGETGYERREDET